MNRSVRQNSHRRVPDIAEGIGKPVGQRDEGQNSQHDYQPKNAAGAPKTVSKTAFHVRRTLFFRTVPGHG